jgi:hypothetical protein
MKHRAMNTYGFCSEWKILETGPLKKNISWKYSLIRFYQRGRLACAFRSSSSVWANILTLPILIFRSFSENCPSEKHSVARRRVIWTEYINDVNIKQETQRLNSYVTNTRSTIYDHDKCNNKKHKIHPVLLRQLCCVMSQGLISSKSGAFCFVTSRSGPRTHSASCGASVDRPVPESGSNPNVKYTLYFRTMYKPWQCNVRFLLISFWIPQCIVACIMKQIASCISLNMLCFI